MDDLVKGWFVGGDEIEVEGVLYVEGDPDGGPETLEIEEDGILGGLGKLGGDGLDREVADFVDVGVDGGLALAEGAGPPGGKFDVPDPGGGVDEFILPFLEDDIFGIETINSFFADFEGQLEAHVLKDGFLELGRAATVDDQEVQGLTRLTINGPEEGVVGGDVGKDEMGRLGVAVDTGTVLGEHQGIAGQEGGGTEFDLGFVVSDDLAVWVARDHEGVYDGRIGLGGGLFAGETALDGAALVGVPLGGVGAGDRIPRGIAHADGVTG